MTTVRSSCLVVGALMSTLLISGCGESTPAKKGASKELDQAQSLVDAGNSAVSGRDYTTALVHFNNAKSRLEEARPNATESESVTLTRLTDLVRKRINETEMKQLEDPKPKDKPLDAEIRKQEDAEAKAKADEKKKADAETKKAADKAAATQRALTIHDSGSGKKEEEGGPALPPSSTAAVNTGDKKPAGEKGALKGEDVAVEPKVDESGLIEKAKPPFPAVTDKSEEVQVIKIGTRGKFVWVFFQVFNKSEDGHRISTVSVTFKDKDRQKLVDERIVATFPFEGFRENAKDMIGDQGTDALTLGSGSIDGRSVKRYVSIGESDARAKDVKIATVQVIYQDGGKPYADGPAGK